ncbi:MAG TPA: hypothetical protein VN426_18115 [Syntrophomonadaceae bacterium]|nr:hypothetical protein [Syntrophomonadaceae bacterium]
MPIKVSKKNIWICLLVCSLFLTSNIGILTTNGIVSSDGYAFNNSSINGGSEHSSMNGVTDLWNINYLSNISSELFVSSTKPSQWLLTKTIFNILTSSITAQIICLIYSSKLTGNLCSQFNSIGITLFLHKKDGMK